MRDLNSVNLVTQSNSLIEARYTLSKNEQLILCAMISFINPEDKEFLTYKTSISQFSELLKIDKKSSMREIDIIVSRLLSRVITIETPNGWKKYQWVSYAEADKKEDFLLLKFHDKLKPYLLELKAKFTSFKIQEVVDLKSVYSIRIYQLLKDYRGRKCNNFTYSVSDLRSILLGEKSKKYPVFSDFKKNILMVAERELKEKAILCFSFKTIKVGRSIGKIEFTIIKKNQPKTTPPPALPPKTGTDQDENQPPEIQEMLSIGIAKEKAISLLEQYGADYIIEKLKITAEENRPSPAGFFIKAATGDWKSKKTQQKAKELERQKKEQAKRRIEAIEKAKRMLENDYADKVKKEYLAPLSKKEKAEVFEEIKKDNVASIPYMDNVETGLGGALLTGLIKKKQSDYDKNQEIFINTELKKMGLIKGEKNDTEK